MSDPDVKVPGIVWWEGQVSCDLCGYGTSGHEVPNARSVVPIPEGQSGPFLLECPGCGNMTLSPVGEEPG